MVENDFVQDYESARAWLDGRDPYEPQAFVAERYPSVAHVDAPDTALYNPHPPAVILITAPLVSLDLRVARHLWLLLDVGFLVFGMALFVRGAGMSWSWAIAIGVGSLVLPIVQDEMSWLQSNGLLLFLIASSWHFLRRDRDGSAGALLGLAAALKLYPAFLIIPLLVTRRLRAALWQVASFLLVSISASAILGMEAVPTYYFEAAPSNFEFWRAYPGNLSLVSLPFRWLSSSPWRPWVTDLPAIAAAVGIALLALCILAAVRTPAHVTGDAMVASLPWMIAASPIMWSHYLVLLLPVVVLGVLRLGTQGGRVVWRFIVGAGLVLAGDAILFDDGTGGTLQSIVWCMPTLGVVLLGLSEWTRRVGGSSEGVVAPYRPLLNGLPESRSDEANGSST